MSATQSTNTKRLYIGNLDEAINEYATMQLFKPFGKITFIEVMVHWTGPKKGQPRGYCFLEYETKEQALKAINAMHGKVIRGRPLVVSFAHMTPEQEEAKKRGQALHKPTTLSLLKGQKMRNSSTDAKIKAIEAKLNSLKRQTAATSSTTSSSSAVNNNRTSTSQNRYKPY